MSKVRLINMKKMIVALSLALIFTIIGGSSGYAYHKYDNWAELEANEVEGEDYMVRSKSNVNSAVLNIAIHGGGIEGGTSELVQEISNKGDTYDYYELDGMKSSGNTILHISSTDYDEPIALDMVGDSLYTVSYHGYYEPDVKKTLMGGKDIELRDAIMKSLQSAGFTVELSSEHLDGDHPANITNKNKQSAGVQLELSTLQRKAFFKDGSISRESREHKTQEFYDYTDAIKRILRCK